MHADRALDLAAPAEQTAEREMQLDGLRIDLHHLDERFDRLVRLLVQQEIQPFEIRHRQRARFRHELLDVDARSEPAQREKQRQSRAATSIRYPCVRRAPTHVPATSGAGSFR